MAKTFTQTFRNVSAVNVVKSTNYVTLESTIDVTDNAITGSFWFHWHEPEGFNCFGVSYLWYIRFLDGNGNTIKDVNVSKYHTNVNNQFQRGERVFYWPASTSQTFPVNSSNIRTEAILDRYANDNGIPRHDVVGKPYWSNVQACKRGEQVRTPDNTRMTFSIPMSEVPSNAKAYCNHVIFAQYTSNGTTPQDPTIGPPGDPSGNQFAAYTFPSAGQAIDDDDTILDFASKLYLKNGNWQNTARIWHKEGSTWIKRYLYKKINGTWTKIP